VKKLEYKVLWVLSATTAGATTTSKLKSLILNGVMRDIAHRTGKMPIPQEIHHAVY
jgi:hypothetical protein